MDLDLINDALSTMGQPRMADAEAAPIGRVQTAAKDMHLPVRREVAEAHRWTACNRVAAIEPEADGLVPPGYSFIGVLPADYVGLWSANQTPFKVMGVGQGESARARIAWRGDASITIDYSADIPYAAMNPLLKRACRDKLIALLMPVQVEDVSARKGADDLAVESEIKCASRDALNRQEQPLFSSHWDPANQAFRVGGRW